MRFKLKVRRGARALVMLIDAPDIALGEFAECRCEPGDFAEALHYAQSHVALPTFLLGGEFAIRAAEHVLDLRGVVARNASDGVAAAVSRLEVPLLLIGGSAALLDASADASRAIGVK